jgi:hypothetical protein
VFISRRRTGTTRLTVWKVGVLFLGAGIWVAGVMINNFQVTAAAIIVVAIGLLLSLVERRQSSDPGDDDGDGYDERDDHPDDHRNSGSQRLGR